MSEPDPLEIEQELAREETAKAAASQEAQWEVSDWAWLMSSKRGRRVVWRLLTNAGVYRLSYVPGDALATAFNEGSRNVGNRLLSITQEHCGSDYGLMVQERSNAR